MSLQKFLPLVLIILMSQSRSHLPVMSIVLVSASSVSPLINTCIYRGPVAILMVHSSRSASGRLCVSLRRCTFSADIKREFSFLTGKLLAKGYSNSEICTAISRACHVHKTCINSTSGPRSRGPRKAFLKVQHSSSCNYKYIHALISRHKHLLGSKIIVAKTVQHSVFRIMYPHTWNKKCSQLAVGGL